jgi:hypothetical protein
MMNNIVADALPTVAQLMRAMRVSARKHLSQNFLLDGNIAGLADEMSVSDGTR